MEENQIKKTRFHRKLSANLWMSKGDLYKCRNHVTPKKTEQKIGKKNKKKTCSLDLQETENARETCS